jgi:hypothetical protein
VVMVKQPGHLTSMKNARGPGTRVCSSSATIDGGVGEFIDVYRGVP